MDGRADGHRARGSDGPVDAAQARAGGVAAAVAATAGAPAWLTAELGRAWAGYGAGLAPALEAAADEPAPTEVELRGLEVPVGLAALVDDPVHPLGVARRWQATLPRSALVTTSLATFGADPGSLGRATVLAWLRAAADDAVRELVLPRSRVGRRGHGR